jgi:hypothetical protein
VSLHGRAAAVARALGSSGRSRVRLAVEGELTLAEFWLLT